jgi:hypothetical protein
MPWLSTRSCRTGPPSTPLANICFLFRIVLQQMPIVIDCLSPITPPLSDPHDWWGIHKIRLTDPENSFWTSAIIRNQNGLLGIKIERSCAYWKRSVPWAEALNGRDVQKWSIWSVPSVWFQEPDVGIPRKLQTRRGEWGGSPPTRWPRSLGTWGVRVT